MKFEVGKYYIAHYIPVEPLSKKYPVFLDHMKEYIGVPLKCIRFDEYGPTAESALLSPSGERDEGAWWWNIAWVKPYEHKPILPKCLCSSSILLGGCKCGAFAAEMVAAGKVYDKFLKTWIKA